MLLAVDTATRVMSLALHNGDDLIAEQTLTAGNQQSALLAPGIASVMRACDVQPSALTAVAVCTGPGSYTGLRIGVALAKGIAGANRLPLIGVSTLDSLAAAQPFTNTRHTLIAIAQAGRGRLIAARYRVKKGRWMPNEAPALTTWGDLLSAIEEQSYITGEIDAEGREALQQAQGQDIPVTLVSAASRLRRAGYLAEEAWRRLHAGEPEHFQPARLQPVYLKSD